MFRHGKKLLIVMLIVLPVITFGHVAVGESPDGLGKLVMGVSGLELDNYKRLAVVIGELPEAATRVGITKSLLRTVVAPNFASRSAD